MVYKKAVSVRDLSGYTVGELVNLSSNDSQRVHDAGVFLMFVYATLLSTAVVLGLGIWLIGPSVIAGCFSFFLVFPIQVLPSSQS